MHTDNKKLIKLIGTKYYLHYLMQKSQCSSLGALQMHIEGKKKTWDQLSKSFYRNMKKSPLRNKVIIEKAEKLYPGSKRNLNHPLWKVLSEPSMNKRQVYATFNELSIDITKYIIHTDSETMVKSPKDIKHSNAWRIVEKGTLDSLAFSLLYMRLMELEQKGYRYCTAKWLAYNNFLVLACDDAFYPILKDVVGIYEEYYHWKNEPIPSEMESIFTLEFSKLKKIPSLNTNFELTRHIGKLTINQLLERGTIKNTKAGKARGIIALFNCRDINFSKIANHSDQEFDKLVTLIKQRKGKPIVYGHFFPE